MDDLLRRLLLQMRQWFLRPPYPEIAEPPERSNDQKRSELSDR